MPPKSQTVTKKEFNKRIDELEQNMATKGDITFWPVLDIVTHF